MSTYNHESVSVNSSRINILEILDRVILGLFNDDFSKYIYICYVAQNDEILILVNCIVLHVNELKLNTPAFNATINFINFIKDKALHVSTANDHLYVKH
jgi:hypothetical protein